MVDVETALAAAVRSGALIRHKILLEEGEFDVRRLWLRPMLTPLLSPGMLDPTQLHVVKSAFRRFVTGGLFTLVKASSPHREVKPVGDIRELKGRSPSVVELRFKPPKRDLRFFGRFVGKDALVLTSFGMKSPESKPIDVKKEQERCDSTFAACNFKLDLVPQKIELCISNATSA
jgi:hypothetical protein